ncbi:hypothetical protein A9Q88_05160 [Gammaproteobacteria bacterium 50_400_T64]|nr:hypothetical protein A9Q88_05160 [Gammaproteobacteria bacterium 50_400_T64]
MRASVSTAVSTLFLFFLFTTPLLATETSRPFTLQPYQASYTAKYNGMPIEAQRELLKLEQGYRLETLANNFLGNMRETEQFHLDVEGRIRTDGYVSKRSFFGSKRKEKLVIDHQLNKAIYTRKKKRRETTLQPDHLGPVSYQLQLRRDLAQADSPLKYTVISHGKIKSYQFERLGEEAISTGIGDITALKIRRIRDNKERETVFWMAEEFAYLPVKIWQREEDGKSYEMTLKSVSFEGRE